MSMPRYQSYGKRNPHHSQRGHPVPSHGHHSQLQRTGSLPAQPPAPAAAPAPAPLAEASAPQQSTAQAAAASANEFTPQSSTNYEQVVRFVRERWLSVKQDLNDPPDDPARRVAYYVEKEPNPKLKDFVPFDLEAFCEQQRIKREKIQQQQQPPPPPPPQ